MKNWYQLSGEWKFGTFWSKINPFYNINDFMKKFNILYEGYLAITNGIDKQKIIKNPELYNLLIKPLEQKVNDNRKKTSFEELCECCLGGSNDKKTELNLKDNIIIKQLK